MSNAASFALAVLSANFGLTVGQINEPAHRWTRTRDEATCITPRQHNFVCIDTGRVFFGLGRVFGRDTTLNSKHRSSRVHIQPFAPCAPWSISPILWLSHCSAALRICSSPQFNHDLDASDLTFAHPHALTPLPISPLVEGVLTLARRNHIILSKNLCRCRNPHGGRLVVMCSFSPGARRDMYR
ncbi:hypothetical protein DFH08DRAFT_149235 [Mycena albidolilacea]|uniref:Secreted protein n=1 Tax=Mycena albidolilacea TaxID=1033008 RepID=A0AAD7ET12_9AGAR|nr:hypothetical protein DFH08DRAFT_149235 [Mycena albidolilacea]